MLSSRSLESALVSPRIFSVHDRGTMTSACLLAPALETMTTCHLKSLVLCHAIIPQSHWDAVCGALSDHLEQVKLLYVMLRPGIWKSSQDTLRRKTESRCSEGKCTLQLSKLYGGEFGTSREIHAEGWWDYLSNAPFVMEG